MTDKKHDVEATTMLQALRDKYQRMLTLRRMHDAGTEHDPRPELRALATAFPGALREIDQLPLHVIEQRVLELDRALADLSATQTWMTWMAEYHGLLRVALRLKRSIPARDRTAAAHELAVQQLQDAQNEAADAPAVATLDRSTLLAMLRPPRGRLSAWVIEQIASRHGVSVDDVRAQLFPAPWPRR